MFVDGCQGTKKDISRDVLLETISPSAKERALERSSCNWRPRPPESVDEGASVLRARAAEADEAGGTPVWSTTTRARA